VCGLPPRTKTQGPDHESGPPDDGRRTTDDDRERAEGAAKYPVLVLRAQFLDDVFERGDDLVAFDAGLREAKLQLECLAGRLVAEDEGLRAPRLLFGGLFPDGFAGRTAVAGDFFDQGDHFLGVSLPNYLQ
jgi:hypothetical protein